MSQIVLLKPQVLINTVDLSNRIDSVEIAESGNAVDTTAFGQTAKTYAMGLQDNKVMIEFQQDFAAAEVEKTLEPLFGTIVPVQIVPVSGATSSVNPAYQFNVLINDWKPIGGKVGELSKASITWPISGLVNVTPSL